MWHEGAASKMQDKSKNTLWTATKAPKEPQMSPRRALYLSKEPLVYQKSPVSVKRALYLSKEPMCFSALRLFLVVPCKALECMGAYANAFTYIRIAHVSSRHTWVRDTLWVRDTQKFLMPMSWYACAHALIYIWIYMYAHAFTHCTHT